MNRLFETCLVSTQGTGEINLPREDPANPNSPIKQPEPGRDYEFEIPRGEQADWSISVPGARGTANADGNGRVRIPIPRGTGGQTMAIYLFRGNQTITVWLEIKPETS